MKNVIYIYIDIFDMCVPVFININIIILIETKVRVTSVDFMLIAVHSDGIDGNVVKRK